MYYSRGSNYRDNRRSRTKPKGSSAPQIIVIQVPATGGRGGVPGKRKRKAPWGWR